MAVKAEADAWEEAAGVKFRSVKVEVDECEVDDSVPAEARVGGGGVNAKKVKKALHLSKKRMKTKKLIFSDAAHRRRLMRLLGSFVGLHKWKDAGLVFCSLVQGCHLGALREDDRRKFWVAMEILSHIDKGSMYPIKIKRAYEGWMISTSGRSKELMKKKYLIQLEYILFLLSLGNISEAYDCIKFLVSDSESEFDPLVNLVAGLICYQLWYKGIPKEMQLTQTLTEMEQSDFQQNQSIRPEIFKSSFPDTGNSYETRTIDQCVSNGSIGNEENESMEIDNSVLEKRQFPPPRGFYANEHDNLSSQNVSLPDDGSLMFPQGLNINLLPLRLASSTNIVDACHHLREGADKDHYLNAVTYLRRAFFSNPPLSSALVPLIQLLLLGGQFEETMIELKKISHSSNGVLPSRLRASLLEHVGSISLSTLIASYEDILEKDPTCRKSILSLISLRKDGRYDTDRLINMIALHLDATFATSDIWEEFAACFLNLQTENSFLDDQMSTDQYITNDKGHFPSSNAVHQSFGKEGIRRSWKLRFKWWSQRHFSEKTRLEELQKGDLELMAFKAASAAHIYEPNLDYVRNVYKFFSRNSNRDKVLILDSHCKNSTQLAKYLTRKGKL